MSADVLTVVVSLAGAIAWTWVLLRSVRRIGQGIPVTDGARIITVAVLALVTVCLTVSALYRIGWVSAELARTSVDVARVVFALGGWIVVWMGRHVPAPVEAEA